MTAWRHPVAWLRDHPRHTDVGMALLLAGLTMVTITVPDATATTPRHANGWSYVLGLLATLPVAARRHRPIAVLSFCTGVTLASQLLDHPDSAITLAPVIAAYSVGAYVHSRRRLQITAFLLLVGLVVANTIAAIVESKAENLLIAIGNGIVFGTAFLAGDNMRRRRERLADLEARAFAEETTRDALAREAGAAERQRIARELHDIVAHSLSVMVVQAGAARRMVATRPERATEALTSIETTGRDALDEMRRLLGVLRADDVPAELAPQPSVAGIAELATADPSLPVDVVVEGDVVPLPAAVDLQAYRIVQESLTNVRKHAGPASRAQVRLLYRIDALEVHVDDDGRGASTRPSAAAGGHGIAGMQERASLCGGELRAGPRPGGGWSVVARLPFVAAREGAA